MSDKIQHPFMMKALRKLAIEGNFLNMIKGINEKPIANIVLSDERLSILPKMGKNTMAPTSITAIQQCTGSSSQCN